MTSQPFDLDAACAAALHRLQETLNRSAGQHLMHLMRKVRELQKPFHVGSSHLTPESRA